MNQDELDSKLLEICESTEDRSKELEMIIIMGADISYDYGEPTFRCCSEGNLEHIKILVKSGVDINDVLLYASEEGYLDGVKYAIENGADDHADRDVALKSATVYGYQDIVEYLKEVLK